MDEFDFTVVIVAAVLVVIFLISCLSMCIFCVQEKEAVVIERLGKFKDVLTPGPHFIVPYLDRAKKISVSYTITDNQDTLKQVKSNSYVISLQNEVLDFPKQNVITRDNASILIDAVLQYRIINPKIMVYSVHNLPNLLSKMLQAELRDVAGSLDVDRIIEDTAILDRVAGELDTIARLWGVKIEMVKIQRVQADRLTDVLAQKKNADLNNKKIIITAKTEKQTAVINAEGQRDQKIREAEGEGQRLVTAARGEAQAVYNNAVSEARSIQEISNSIDIKSEDPTRYLLALKYIEVLKSIAQAPNTEVICMPREAMFAQMAKLMGMNTMATTSL
ncbi:hypothetical protein WA158_001228 [Blastocystis sp. Blastoise]